LDEIVSALLKKYGLKLRTSEVLYHDDYMKKWPWSTPAS